jgi:hypothetical protein
MANWASLGHAMRRRIGAPSNHLESAGKNMSVKSLGNAENPKGNARIPMGAVTPPLKGKVMPKKNTQAGDPTAGGKANRTNIERIGATYRITAKYGKSVNPEAGATMANARIVPSVQGKSRPNFNDGMQSNY